MYWAGLGPQVPYRLPLHSPQPHLSTDTPGQDPPPGHTGTRRDMQHCGMEQSGTRHGKAGALTLELAASSSQGQVCSSTQALMRQGRGEGTRTGTGLFFWSYSEGSGPQAEGPDVGTWGDVPLETLEWDCSPTAVMQAAASLLSNTEKQHEPS